MRALILLAVLLGLIQMPKAWATDAGAVLRVQGMAEAVTASGRRTLSQGDPVKAGDRLVTAKDARLKVRFADDMMLTLGGEAAMTVEAFAFGTSRDKVAMTLDQGAFLLETGRIGKLPDHPLVVKTPVASVGVRGTKFWGGSLDAPLDVLLLDGRIVVTSPKGSVDLSQPGAGTSVTAPGAAPLPPGFWSEERKKRAFDSVTFR